MYLRRRVTGKKKDCKSEGAAATANVAISATISKDSKVTACTSSATIPPSSPTNTWNTIITDEDIMNALPKVEEIRQSLILPHITELFGVLSNETQIDLVPDISLQSKSLSYTQPSQLPTVEEEFVKPVSSLIDSREAKKADLTVNLSEESLSEVLNKSLSDKSSLELQKQDLTGDKWTPFPKEIMLDSEEDSDSPELFSHEDESGYLFNRPELLMPSKASSVLTGRRSNSPVKEITRQGRRDRNNGSCTEEDLHLHHKDGLQNRSSGSGMTVSSKRSLPVISPAVSRPTSQAKKERLHDTDTLPYPFNTSFHDNGSSRTDIDTVNDSSKFGEYFKRDTIYGESYHPVSANMQRNILQDTSNLQARSSEVPTLAMLVKTHLRNISEATFATGKSKYLKNNKSR
ncbi:hypothetical protein V1511DRAFT_80590 [Dipodascopsis uninucleata]